MCCPSASLTAVSSPSLQLKSNVLPFAGHDKHTKMCERLRAEVRCGWGGQGSVFSRSLLGTQTSELQKPSERCALPPRRWQICGRGSAPAGKMSRGCRKTQHCWLPAPGTQSCCPGEAGGEEGQSLG